MTRADDAGDGRVFDIEITCFQDDRIWLATSDDIKGLTVEADSFQTFLETTGRRQRRLAGSQSWPS